MPPKVKNKETYFPVPDVSDIDDETSLDRQPIEDVLNIKTREDALRAKLEYGATAFATMDPANWNLFAKKLSIEVRKFGLEPSPIWEEVLQDREKFLKIRELILSGDYDD